MTTFNGESFVEEQLSSILTQTEPPHEIIVHDDGSSDRTVDMVRSMLTESPIASRVVINGATLGVTVNFASAISAATGDIIALADQDDIWMPDKLSVIARTFRAHPGAAAVCSDALVIDETSRPTGERLWQRVGLGRPQRARFETGHGTDVLVRRNVLTGACLAFDAQLRRLLLPMPDAGLHDLWIALLASALGTVVLVEQPLLAYRIHGANAVGLPSRRLAHRVRDRVRLGRVQEAVLEQHEAALTRVRSVADARVSAVDAISRKVDHLRLRANLPPRWAERVPPVVRALVTGRYSLYSSGLQSALYDICWG
jgi:glycosyltransferase involved in cell wall biosynthesis